MDVRQPASQPLGRQQAALARPLSRSHSRPGPVLAGSSSPHLLSERRRSSLASVALGGACGTPAGPRVWRRRRPARGATTSARTRKLASSARAGRRPAFPFYNSARRPSNPSAADDHEEANRAARARDARPRRPPARAANRWRESGRGATGRPPARCLMAQGGGRVRRRMRVPALAAAAWRRERARGRQRQCGRGQ